MQSLVGLVPDKADAVDQARQCSATVEWWAQLLRWPMRWDSTETRRGGECLQWKKVSDYGSGGSWLYMIAGIVISRLRVRASGI